MIFKVKHGVQIFGLLVVLRNPVGRELSKYLTHATLVDVLLILRLLILIAVNFVNP
jgi:hypothetical protein